MLTRMMRVMLRHKLQSWELKLTKYGEHSDNLQMLQSFRCWLIFDQVLEELAANYVVNCPVLSSLQTPASLQLLLVLSKKSLALLPPYIPMKDYCLPDSLGKASQQTLISLLRLWTYRNRWHVRWHPKLWRRWWRRYLFSLWEGRGLGFGRKREPSWALVGAFWRASSELSSSKLLSFWL